MVVLGWFAFLFAFAAPGTGWPHSVLAGEMGSHRVPAAAAPDTAAFVRVSGNRFMLGGRPFHFVGANLAIMHGPEGRAAADRVLEGAASDGLRVGRIWALGEGDADAAPWLRENFLFRAGPEGWIDAAAVHLDHVVAAAGRAGVRLIVTLSNSWSDYGGVPRYLRWAHRWSPGVYGVTDRFYSDVRTRAAFREHVRRLVQRTNQVTGVRYRDDPTILAWELMNESSAATPAGVEARLGWVTEMARLIHHLDPNHLVTPGVSGYRYERERREWLAVCRLPEVDFCDSHLYPEDLLQARDEGILEAVLDEQVRLARTVAGKPFVLGEFGIRGADAPAASARSSGRSWRGQSRATWIARILERLRLDGAAGGLLWIYQGAGGADRAHGITVGPPGTNPEDDAVRAAMAAAARATAIDEVNPTQMAGSGTRELRRPATTGDTAAPGRDLLPLHAEFDGKAATVPVLGPAAFAAGAPAITWDPAGYARADWEASGVFGGGAIEHAWGAEVGWFEYEYLVLPQALQALPAPRSANSVARPRGSAAVRVRLSSEYPGSLSPPEGASVFEVALDGVVLGVGVAPRDDGRGQWVTVRGRDLDWSASDPRAPGRHRLRFTVHPGPRAHGLSVYGRPGEKSRSGADMTVDTGPIELRLTAPPARGTGR